MRTAVKSPDGAVPSQTLAPAKEDASAAIEAASALEATAIELVAASCPVCFSQAATDNKSAAIRLIRNSGLGKVFIEIPLLFVIAVVTSSWRVWLPQTRPLPYHSRP